MSFDPKKPRQVIDQMIFEEVKSLPCDSDGANSDDLDQKLHSGSKSRSGSKERSQPSIKPDSVDGMSLNSDLNLFN